MNNQENHIYLQKVDEIGEDVYKFYNMSGRDDLIMVYEMKKELIYSYIYEEFRETLNEKSKTMLEKQYREAQASNQIVLFIRDELRKKLKAFTI